MNQSTVLDCQVWDSVTGEWSRVTAVVPDSGQRDHEGMRSISEDINSRVSIALGEEPDAWIVMDAHALNAAGDEVILVQLRNKSGPPAISVIIAVRAQ